MYLNNLEEWWSDAEINLLNEYKNKAESESGLQEYYEIVNEARLLSGLFFIPQMLICLQKLHI